MPLIDTTYYQGSPLQRTNNTKVDAESIGVQTRLRAVARSNVSFDDTLLIAERCFGELGRTTVHLWQQYNRDYFGGVLRATPVLYVPTSPYGHWVGCTVRDANIYLMFPRDANDDHYRKWPYVRGVLLHEMIHQYLAQLGKDPAHAGQPWCDEIMRISQLLGRNIWAGKYIVKRVNGKSVRANELPPESTEARILDQAEIARWPYTVGIEPPDLIGYSQLEVIPLGGC
jgi:hypothetical protein